jgi:HAD superfamily hydrolase (TIGR01549 family)
MGVLIDLDLTLVDSRLAEKLRSARQWPEVYKLIPQFIAYEGVDDLMLELAEKAIPVCIVTSSPKPYCGRVIERFKWKNVKSVCYHDTQRHKPYPDPILRGLSLTGLKAEEVLSVGDDPKDVVASKAAGVCSVGALWGAVNRNALIESRPDALCETVAELRNLIFTYLKK